MAVLFGASEIGHVNRFVANVARGAVVCELVAQLQLADEPLTVRVQYQSWNREVAVTRHVSPEPGHALHLR